MSASNRSGRNHYILVSGETFAVWADNEDQAKQKLYDIRFDVLGCPVCPTEDCECVNEVGYLTTPIRVNGTDIRDTDRIMEDLNADALISLLPIYYRQRLKDIIEGESNVR